VTTKYRTLYVDPGETVGWALAKGGLLLAGGQCPMWEFYDELHAQLHFESNASIGDGMLKQGKSADLRKAVKPAQNSGSITRIVCEDWKLYPDKLKSMKWDPCRTARLIGGITGLCRQYFIDLELQPAAIKDAAQRAGAKELYYRPLHPNRHANDAIQHFVYDRLIAQGGQPIQGLKSAPPSALDGVPQL
jgi:hypothetical protein